MQRLERQYLAAELFFRKPQWTRKALVSKRLRMVVRLIAVEERCRELSVGALPPKMMEQLRLLAGYKDATNLRKGYSSRSVGRPRTKHVEGK